MANGSCTTFRRTRMMMGKHLVTMRHAAFLAQPQRVIAFQLTEQMVKEISPRVVVLRSWNCYNLAHTLLLRVNGSMPTQTIHDSLTAIS